MSIAIAWSPYADATILQLRAAGVPWHAVASELRIGRNSIIERARRLGLAPVTRLQPAPKPAPVRIDRPALPAGHPHSWQAITGNTPLDGEPYPFPVFL